MDERRRVPRARVVDLAVTASAGLADAYAFAARAERGAEGADGWPAAALLLVAALSLLGRRGHPVVVFALVWACGVLAAPLGGGALHLTAIPCAALFTVALTRPATVSAAALAACSVLALPPVLFLHLLLYAGVWTAGRWTRVTRRRAERDAVLAERARIARELHDIVAHAVTAMVLQAAGARRVLATDPARVRQALGHVEETGEQAMGELRRMFAALRPDRAAGEGPGAVPDRPQPGLADLDHLVHAVAAAGVRVHTRVEGQPRHLAASVDLAAYRVVQEALTDATRHAGPGSTAEVRLRWGEADLTVEVTDNGRARRPDRGRSADHDLSGLHERLAIVGGRLVTDLRRGDGCRLAAVLPVSTPRPAPAPVTAKDRR
ncbi:sensor histidine kinase [Saccharothrix syringae]|uniref:histidine kinase n=1 Tax=Saccharothrix syringae TaxID=103733 RepID=A0A5Q0GZK6_SACSY|nr:histidine kinase [Saccharothrix syringae]QFZ19447.1 two-component sensor histidine kinase [Saccharothrix syringae]